MGTVRSDPTTLNPNHTDPPAGIAVVQGSGVIVTNVPLCEERTPYGPEMLLPGARLNVSVHVARLVCDVFRNVSVAPYNEPASHCG